jgi:periplasmic divalent cation tolerance protein
MSTDIRFVYMTAGGIDEARRIGGHLVSGKLAACVNILEGMNSLYVWEGKLQDDREVVLIAKTTAARVDELVETVCRLHSYDCPCVLVLPVTGGNTEFLNWIAGEVTNGQIHHQG